MLIMPMTWPAVGFFYLMIASLMMLTITTHPQAHAVLSFWLLLFGRWDSKDPTGRAQHVASSAPVRVFELRRLLAVDVMR